MPGEFSGTAVPVCTRVGSAINFEMRVENIGENWEHPRVRLVVYEEYPFGIHVLFPLLQRLCLRGFVKLGKHLFRDGDHNCGPPQLAVRNNGFAGEPGRVASALNASQLERETATPFKVWAPAITEKG